jgi:hypothetical protein
MSLRSRTIWQAVAGAVAVGVVGGTVVAFAKVRICDQQVTTDGAVVSVCRHLQATDPPVLAGGLVLLVALGAFFTEISGFGISLKQAVQDVKRTAEEAQSQATEAKAATQTFEETATDLAEGVEQALAGGRHERQRTHPESPREELDDLAEEYNHVRWTMPGGRERTTAMTSIVYKMIETAKKISDFDVTGYMRTNNAGRRLAGYAYLFAHPEPAWMPALAEAVLVDDKPFNQYWALRALDVQGIPLSSTLDRDLLRRLRERLPDLESDASRHRLLSDLLQRSR